MSFTRIGTSLAIVERDDDGLIYIRIRPNARMNIAGYAEILAARKELAGGKPAGVISVIPEDTDFDNAVLRVDHHAGHNVGAFTKAMAIVSPSSLYGRLFELYASYFQQEFAFRLFDNEPEAVAWMKAHLAQAERA